MDTPETQGTILGLWWVSYSIAKLESLKEKSPSQRSGILLISSEGNRSVGNEPVARTKRTRLSRNIEIDHSAKNEFPEIAPSAKAFIYIYPPKDCFRFHMGLHLYSTRPEKIKNPQLKGHSTISYIFLFWWFPLLNFKKLGSRADRRNSDQFSVQNQVLKTWSACFLVWSINVFQGKCSKDRILGNQMWLWSVGVCFEANQLHIESRHLLAYLNA